jgi:cleavage and polyadenylation specificity factor subunit 1
MDGVRFPSFILLSYLSKANHSRLREFKDTVRLVIFTLNIVTQNYPIIRSVKGLPHECLALLPCGTSLGGVVIISTNAIVYVDPSSKHVVLPVNGWVSRISDSFTTSTPHTRRAITEHLIGRIACRIR